MKCSHKVLPIIIVITSLTFIVYYSNIVGLKSTTLSKYFMGSSESTTKKTCEIPVLLYHHLASPDENFSKDNGAIVPVEEFEAQMKWLNANGYTTPTLKEFEMWIKGKKELPPKTVLITFDDGYRSNFTLGFPILEKYRYQAVIFVVGDFIGKTIGNYEYLKWSDIRAMKKSGLINIQSHTYDGHKGTHTNPIILTWTEQQIQEDLIKLNSLFTVNGLEIPFAFAYPFGVYSDVIIQNLQELNYQMAFTTEHGFASQKDNPFKIKRIIIWPGTTLEQFKYRITPPDNYDEEI